MMYTTISYLNVLMSYVTSKSISEQAMSRIELMGMEREFRVLELSSGYSD